MGIVVNEKKNANFEIAPEGAFPAKCYRIIDLGTHIIMGQYGAKSQRLIQFYFELPTEFTSEHKPFVILSRRFNVTFGDKSNLTKFLKSWIRADYCDGFDFSSLLGRSAFLTVVHTPDAKDPGVIYANIASIMPLPAGMSVPDKTFNEPLAFFLGKDFDQKRFELLPQKTRDFIAKSKEYGELMNSPLVTAMKDMAADMKRQAGDEIPFS